MHMGVVGVFINSTTRLFFGRRCVTIPSASMHDVGLMKRERRIDNMDVCIAGAVPVPVPVTREGLEKPACERAVCGLCA